MNKILAPQLNANENEVFIAEWKFKNNDFIINTIRDTFGVSSFLHQINLLDQKLR